MGIPLFGPQTTQSSCVTLRDEVELNVLDLDILSDEGVLLLQCVA